MTKTNKFEDAVSAVLSGADPDQVADHVIAETTTSAENVEATPEPVKKVTIGAVIETLLMDASMSYSQIVDCIHSQFQPCNTSARSVASIAARLRRTGVDVPMRRGKAAGE